MRVSIKPAVGKPLVRRYRKSDLVRLLFAVAKQSVPEAAQGRSFALFTSFPKADLSEHLDQSIGDAGLGGAQVIMQWV